MTAEAALVEAEALFRLREHGVLCTLSERAGGWPFGSVVPYAVDVLGRPIILIATIAEHTKNVVADSRVSLLVQAAEGEGDVQAKGRLTVMGRAERVPEQDLADSRARYLARLPEAAGYFETHDFFFYRIAVERLRYIGGFGRIHWLDVDMYTQHVRDDPLVAGAKPIVDHMNDDHEDALQLYCRAFRGLEPKAVRMVGVDRWGLDVECEAPDVRLRFDFGEAAAPDTIRRIVVAMVAKARNPR